MSKDTSEPGLVDDLIAEFRESLRRDGFNHSALLYAQNARHFVVWLENEGARLADSDDALLHRFARHSSARVSWTANGPRPRRGSRPPERFGSCGSWKREILFAIPARWPKASVWRKRSRNPCAPRASSRPPPIPTGARSLTLSFGCTSAGSRWTGSTPAWRLVSPLTIAYAWDPRGVLQSSGCATGGGSRPELPASRTSGPAAMPGQENSCASPGHRTRAWSRSGSGCCGIGVSRSAASTCTRASCVRC